jgi:hypothetical protein
VDPLTQTIRPEGFSGSYFGNVGGGPKEIRDLIFLLNSPSGRRALSLSMLAAETPRQCLDRVMIFCKAATKEDLLEGEPYMWLKRLITRAANVRID